MLGGDLNTTKELKEPQQQQSEEATNDSKVESEDEGTGQDLPESCENSGDEEPVTNEQVAEELIEGQESESVVQEEKEVNDIGSGEEVQDLENEESLDKEANKKVEEPLEEEEEADHNKENHVNGTSAEQNNHFEPEEQLTKEEEENNKNKEQESGDIVDYKKKVSKQEESQQSISELKSKWDSFGKEHSDSPTDHSHRNEGDNMADTAKTSRFGGTVEKCNQCQKTVYAMERMEVAGRLMHKTCFRCCKCNSPLSVGRFSVGGGELYCMTHYKQAFREKGTYDVFTPDNPIKGKWQNKPAE